MIILSFQFNLMLHIWEYLIMCQKNKSTTNISSGTARFDLIFSDYVRNDDLNNYYKISEPIDMGGNRITSLGKPTEITDAINRNFLHRRLTAATTNLKSEINTSISDLTKTDNEKVSDLESKITKGAVDLQEMNKLIEEQIKVINNILESFNNKDILTAEDIKGINNTLTTLLKDIETEIVDFNKKFIDTEEL